MNHFMSDDLFMIKNHHPSRGNFFKYLCVLILGLTFYLFFIALFNKGLADYDLWGYLSFGRVFWEEGFFPYKDAFAYTPTKPLWVYHEWLTGVVFFGLAKYLGPASLQLLRYILAILTIYLIYETAIKRGGAIFYVLMALVASMALISFGYVPVRAQVFTFLFFMLTLYILEHSRITGQLTLLRWLPLIQIFWCNFHGGFVSGLGLIFLYALGDGIARKKIAFAYLQWGMISSLASLINPYGVQYWVYTIDAILMPRPQITEWYSVVTALKSNIHIFPVVLFITMGLMLLFVSVMRKKKDITELLVIAVVVYLGSVHVRHGILLGLVFGAYLPSYLTEYAADGKVKRKSLTKLVNVLVIICACLLITVPFYSMKKINFIPSFKLVVSSDSYPTKAMRWMNASRIKGNILPNFEWGEYLIWSFYPDCHVAMDGRYETVYQDKVHQEYFDFLYGNDHWRVFLEKYPHDIVLLKARTKTHWLMSREKDWRLVYADETSVLFMRK